MLRLYDYECEPCGRTFEAMVEAYDEAVFCNGCGGLATKIMSAPAIHTLETHMRGYQPHSAEENFSPGHGGFRDINLCDPVTGKPAVYSSLAEKKALMKKFGVQQKEPTKDRFKMRKSKRPMVFDGSSHRRSQQGIN